MKLIHTPLVIAALICASLAGAQSIDPSTSSGTREFIREYQEGPDLLLSKDYQWSYSRLPVSNEGTYRRAGRQGEYGWVHYRNRNEFKYESLAGRQVLCDRKTDLPLQVVACGNLIWQRSAVKTETRTLTYQRTLVREYRVTVPGPERRVEVPVYVPVDRPVEVPKYIPVMLLPTQQQHIANLGAPTVISPVIGGVSFNAQLGKGNTFNVAALAFGGAGGAGGSSSSSSSSSSSAAAAGG
jgi:hypothetical protein